MSEHRSPRTRLPKPRSTYNRARRRAAPYWPKPSASLLREHGIERAFRFASNATTGQPLDVILDVLRTVDRRKAMRLVEALARFVTLATKPAKRAVKP